MAQNSVSSLNPAFWAKEAEKSLFVENMAMTIANTTLLNYLAGEGDTVNKTIVSYPASATYTPGTDITQTLVTGSKEALTASTFIASLVKIDDTEKVQSIIELGTNISHKMMKDHNNRIEQQVLAEVTNALWTLDDGNVGGTAGNNATVNTNTVPQFFIAADTKLDAIDAPKAGRTAVVGGHFMGQLKLQQAGRPGSPLADAANARGYVGTLFGYNIIYTNNLPYTAVLTLTVTPTANDTVTIAGVVSKFVSAIGTTAGNVLFTSATDARANLATLLNAPATTTATGVAYASEDVFLLRDKRRLVAVDDTSTKITITGFGDIVVASSFTSATNQWGSQRQDALFLVSGSIDMVVQIPPKIEVTRDPKQFADIVKSMIGFGKKTYADGARQMVRVKINAGTSDWV